MAHITEKDYRKLADAVAEDLVKGDIPLNDSISKLASQMDLSQEQLCRLCEATNNTTFNKLFSSRDKTAEDRMIEFDVADPNKVLNGIIKEAEYMTGTYVGSDLYEMRSLEDEMHATRHAEPEYSQEKTAFVLRPESRPSAEKDRRTLQKTYDHLKHEKLAADMAYHDALKELCGRFSRLYDVMPFTQFEKEAASRYKIEATGPLNELRHYLNLPEAEYAIDRLDKTAGYVDDTTHEMQLFSDLLKLAKQRTQFRLGLEKLEQLL